MVNDKDQDIIESLHRIEKRLDTLTEKSEKLLVGICCIIIGLLILTLSIFFIYTTPLIFEDYDVGNAFLYGAGVVFILFFILVFWYTK
ncbi:MAG: hypothetical protein ACOCSL_01345 [Thermoplasmatota archaeon]